MKKSLSIKLTEQALVLALLAPDDGKAQAASDLACHFAHAGGLSLDQIETCKDRALDAIDRENRDSLETLSGLLTAIGGRA